MRAFGVQEAAIMFSPEPFARDDIGKVIDIKSVKCDFGRRKVAEKDWQPLINHANSACVACSEMLRDARLTLIEMRKGGWA